MTIGIAAYGTNAGAGALAALRAVEQVGRGAIGGFISLAVITAKGDLLRAETQSGGTGVLWTDPLFERISVAPCIGLISSGANRPGPLSNFVSADPQIGIVSGHRMPQTPTPDGERLNDVVLAMMRAGHDPQAAIDAVIAQYPGMDAGFVACSTGGKMGLGNMPSVLLRDDHGSVVLRSDEGTECVAAVHNAIQPCRAIGALAGEIALDVMVTQRAPAMWIKMRSGLSLNLKDRNAVHVDADCMVQQIDYATAAHLIGDWSIGLGDKVPVLSGQGQTGWLGYEPFMTIKNGLVKTIDGLQECDIPVFDRLPLRFDGTGSA